MKKVISLFFMLMMVCVKVFAADIEVQPTMMSKSNAKDRVWVGTFQLVWNDFTDKFVHNYVRFKEGTPDSVWELNAREFSAADISDKCYYKTAGKITKNTKKQIEKAIKKKFNETSDILDKMDLTPSPSRFLIYAMLKKDFEFINAFDKLGVSDFGENQKAEYFGISPASNKKLDKGVKVLFYNNPNDYAVVLSAKNNEQVYLYKTASNKPFNKLYSDMNKKEAGYDGDKTFKENDELKVPNIKFYTEKNFSELTNKRVMGTNIVIEQAIESVKFEMDYKGVELKSEAAMSIMKTSFRPDADEPRRFYFDNTFVVFMKEAGKRTPYFALRVNDITKFQ